MRVLQPRQRQVLVAVAGRELDDQRAIGQRGLDRQKDAALTSAAKLAHEPQLADLIANFRKRRRRRLGVHQAVAIQHDRQRLLPARKAGIDFLADDALALFFAQANLFEHQPHGGLLAVGKHGWRANQVSARTSRPAPAAWAISSTAAAANRSSGSSPARTPVALWVVGGFDGPALAGRLA